MTIPAYRSNEEREMRGCIVTLRHRETGALVSRHLPGLVVDALPAFLDRYPPEEWSLASYSTTRTILSDVRGARTLFHDRPSDDRGMALADLPELHMLARVGRSAYREDAV